MATEWSACCSCCPLFICRFPPSPWLLSFTFFFSSFLFSHSTTSHSFTHSLIDCCIYSSSYSLTHSFTDSLFYLFPFIQKANGGTNIPFNPNFVSEEHIDNKKAHRICESLLNRLFTWERRFTLKSSLPKDSVLHNYVGKALTQTVGTSVAGTDYITCGCDWLYYL